MRWSARVRWVSGLLVWLFAAALVPLVLPARAQAADTVFVSVGDLEVFRPAGRASIYIPFTISEPQPVDVSITWTVSDGSALPGEDFVAPPGGDRVTVLSAGKTRVYGSLAILPDPGATTDEDLEISIVSVAGASNLQVGRGVGRVVLKPFLLSAPPSPFNFAVGNASVVEGDDGGPAQVRVPISIEDPTVDPANQPFEITYRIVVGTASSGADHEVVGTTRTARFYPRAGVGWLNATIYGDRRDEPDEDFTVELVSVTHPTTASIWVTPRGTVRILDDDDPQLRNLWGLGANSNGALGQPLSTMQTFTKPVRLRTGGNFIQVAAGGGSAAFAVREDGTIGDQGSLWGWGFGSGLELMVGSRLRAPAPSPRLLVPAQPRAFVKVTATQNVIWALAADHTLWLWGNSQHQNAPPSGMYHVGTQVGGAEWADISVGLYHAVAVKTDGTLWASGVIDMVQIGSDNDWASVEAGATLFAMKRDGSLWQFTSTLDTPQQVMPGSTWRVISGGDDHNLAIRSDGTLWAWGDNNSGELGTGDTDPTRVRFRSVRPMTGRQSALAPTGPWRSRPTERCGPGETAP